MAYKRVGKNNVKMDRDEIVNLLKKTYELSYEDVEIAEIEEVDLEKVRSFIHRAVETRSTMMPSDELTVLRNLGMVEGRVRMAAILLFGKSPQAKLPWAIVKIGRFVEGENRPVLEKEVGVDLVEQIEKSYAEILSLVRKEIKIEGTTRRRSVYEYPPEAMRELVVNAISHRDYSVRSPTYVKIFEDKIVFENPGGLPFGITVNDLKKPHRSVLRNPKIANALYNFGYIEKWGIGTLETLRRCALNGNGEPIFNSNGTFRVEVRSRYKADTSDEERTILNYLRDKGEASRRELEKPLKLSESMVRKLLERLQSKGLVVKEGKGKKVKYRLAF